MTARRKARWSAWTAPPAEEFACVNERMLRRCRDRERVRELWRVGEPYADRPAHVVHGRRPRRRFATALDEVLSRRPTRGT